MEFPPLIGISIATYLITSLTVNSKYSKVRVWQKIWKNAFFDIFVRYNITSDAGYFVPNICFYCELWLYYRFFGKFLFHSANLSCPQFYIQLVFKAPLCITLTISDQKIVSGKGQIISVCLFDFLNFPKKHRKIWQISAQESKKWSNQQSINTFL